jgi:hypothetical protein
MRFVTLSDVTQMSCIEELRYLYAAPHVIRVVESRRIRWAGHIVSMREMRNAYKICVGKHEGKRSFGRRRRRWEDIIRSSG